MKFWQILLVLVLVACGAPAPAPIGESGGGSAGDSGVAGATSVASLVHVIVASGQSNGLYPGRGEIGTLPDVRYFYVSHARPENSGGHFVDLVGNVPKQSGGYDFTIGRRLHEAGWRVAIINLTAGSTHYNEWMPAEAGAGESRELLAEFDKALAQLRSVFPDGSRFVFTSLRNQGQTDTRVDSLEYQVGGGKYVGWARGYEIWHQALLDHIVAAGFEGELSRYIVQSCTGITRAFHMPAIFDQQALAAGDPRRAIPFEDRSLYDPDVVHMTNGGFEFAGETIADRMLQQ